MPNITCIPIHMHKYKLHYTMFKHIVVHQIATHNTALHHFALDLNPSHNSTHYTHTCTHRKHTHITIHHIHTCFAIQYITWQYITWQYLTDMHTLHCIHMCMHTYTYGAIHICIYHMHACIHYMPRMHYIVLHHTTSHHFPLYHVHAIHK